MTNFRLQAVANEHVRRGIPLSLIIIDYFSWNDPVTKTNTIGDETLPQSCWPDPKLMVEQLKAIGVELMISPYSHSVGKASHNWYKDFDIIFAPCLTGFPALHHSSRGVQRALPGGHAYGMLIGACNPMV